VAKKAATYVNNRFRSLQSCCDIKPCKAISGEGFPGLTGEKNFQGYQREHAREKTVMVDGF